MKNGEILLVLKLTQVIRGGVDISLPQKVVFKTLSSNAVLDETAILPKKESCSEDRVVAWLEKKYPHLPLFCDFSIGEHERSPEIEQYSATLIQCAKDASQSVSALLGTIQSKKEGAILEIKSRVISHLQVILRAEFYKIYAAHKGVVGESHPVFVLANMEANAAYCAEVIVSTLIDNHRMPEGLSGTFTKIIENQGSCVDALKIVKEASKWEEERTEHPNNHLSYKAADYLADINSNVISYILSETELRIDEAVTSLLKMRPEEFKVKRADTDTQIAIVARNEANYNRLYRHYRSTCLYLDRIENNFDQFKEKDIQAVVEDPFAIKCNSEIVRLGGRGYCGVLTPPIKTAWSWDIDGNYEAGLGIVETNHTIQIKSHLNCYKQIVGQLIERFSTDKVSPILMSFNDQLSSLTGQSTNDELKTILVGVKSRLSDYFKAIQLKDKETNLKSLEMIKVIYDALSFIESHQLMSGNTLRQDGNHFKVIFEDHFKSFDRGKLITEIDNIKIMSFEGKVKLLQSMIETAKEKLGAAGFMREDNTDLKATKTFQKKMRESRVNTLEIFLDLLKHPDRKGMNRFILSNFGKESDGVLENMVNESLAGKFFFSLLGLDQVQGKKFAFLSESETTLKKMEVLIAELGKIPAFYAKTIDREPSDYFEFETLTGPSDYKKENGLSGDFELLEARQKMHEAADRKDIPLKGFLGLGTSSPRAAGPFLESHPEYLSHWGKYAIRCQAGTQQGIDGHLQSCPELGAEKNISIFEKKIEAFCNGIEVFTQKETALIDEWITGAKNSTPNFLKPLL